MVIIYYGHACSKNNLTLCSIIINYAYGSTTGAGSEHHNFKVNDLDSPKLLVTLQSFSDYFPWSHIAHSPS